MNAETSQRLRQERWRRLGALGAGLGVVSLAGVTGCAGAGREAAVPEPSSPATIVRIETTRRTVFVMAARQKPRIVESLEAAGIPVTTNLLEARFTLRVTAGVDQGWDDCGTRSNVKYSLRREGEELVEFVEKGWTGTCTPNVFDALSGRLAETLVQVEDTPAAPPAP